MDKATLLSESDVISLHVDLNPSSVGLLRAADFKQMQPRVGVMNASRGPVVDTNNLISALQNCEIEAAALDTVTGEATVFNHD